MNAVNPPTDPMVPPRSGIEAVTEPLPLAVVGLRFGLHAVRWIEQKYRTRAVRVVLVCDRQPALARAAGEELGVPWTTELDDVLRAPVAAVALFTPPDGRLAVLERLVAGGKHVMTTKPFALDARAAQNALDAARACGRVIHLNSPNPEPAADVAQMVRWCGEYDLGKAVALRADAWASYHEVADGSWYDDPARCPVAPILRIGMYLIHDALYLLGSVAEVGATTSRVRTGRPTPDQAILTLRHHSGALTAITCSFCVDDGLPWRNALTLNLERGTIYRNVGLACAAQGAGLSLRARGATGEVLTRTSSFAPHWSGEYDWDAFALAVRQGRTLSRDTQSLVLAGICVIQAATVAVAAGRTVLLDS